MFSRTSSNILPALALLWAAAAQALPAEQTATGDNRGAELTLTVLGQAITDDVRSFCRVRIVYVNEGPELEAGDTLDLEVLENDGVFNDVLWATTFQVTAQEGDADRFDRTFDCSSAFGSDGIGDLEIFARASLDREDCGIVCNDADPATDQIEVLEVEDDDAEENDDAGSASAIALGRNADLVARDQDWFDLTLADPSRVQLDVLHRPGAGRLDAALFGADGGQIAVGQDADDRTLLVFEPLLPGDYRLRVSPRQANDFNFYDATLAVQTVVLRDCDPGDVETQPCGSCGEQERTCDPEGRWGPFAACLGEGACAPGDTRGTPCGRCGTRNDTCSDACEWQLGACGSEGVCSPGDEESEACPEGGDRLRACNEACAWGAFGVCEGGACDPGEMRACYGGAEGTEGVGPCRGGRQSCAGGTWGDCADQVLPVAEACDDGVDNDCDMAVDAADDDCTGMACDDGESRPCYPGPMGTEGVGACRSGRQVCAAMTWGPCEDAVVPISELCDDGADNDCDRAADDRDSDCAPRAGIGEPCARDDACTDPLECLGSPDEPMFTDGYCGVAQCRASCGMGTACVQAFGERYCLKRCSAATDCRMGYLCGDLGGVRACVPRCEDDSDCRGRDRPVCDLQTGSCTDMASMSDAGIPGGRPDVGPGGGGADLGVRADGGMIPGAGGGGGDDGCNCDLAGRGRVAPWWLLLGLPLVIWRSGRRSRRRAR